VITGNVVPAVSSAETVIQIR